MVNTDGNKSQFRLWCSRFAGNYKIDLLVYKNPYMTENTILVGFRGSK